MSSRLLGPTSLPGGRHCVAPHARRSDLRLGGASARLERAVRVRAASSGGSHNPKGGREWLQTLLSRFGPMTERAQNTTVLDFEKPLVELDNRIKEVRRVAEENGVDVTGQIGELEARARQLRRDTYNRLTPVQRLAVARHPNRPTFLDIALNITDKFVELHGDRAGLDDPAIVCGLASMEGRTFMFIGHQKGRNTKENIYRNFGMPQPNGYRKALRFMRHAEKFGFPIVTFVDTPGAYAGKNAEDLGQGEAIAVNLREMFGLTVPLISIVIGEGGSGGALAIGCSNWNLIMEHSVYYVASPEACAAILWKSRERAPTATEALKITAPELINFGVMDEIIPEPLGGAHSDPMASFPYIKEALLNIYNTKYRDMSGDEVMAQRYAKFRKLGHFSEFDFAEGAWQERRPFRLPKADSVLSAPIKEPWLPTDEEEEMLEGLLAREESWDASRKSKMQWNVGLDPGKTGVFQPSADVVATRKKQLDAARKALQAKRGGSASSPSQPQASAGSNGAEAPAAESPASNGAEAEVPHARV